MTGIRGATVPLVKLEVAIGAIPLSFAKRPLTVESMTGLEIKVAVALAAAEGRTHVPYFPLPYQIACAVLTALFIWSFSIGRDPRGWRRLYQAKFSKKEDFSVNRNKRLDEIIKKYGITIAMVILMADAGIFVLGVTYRYRNTPQTPMNAEEKLRSLEAQRLMESASKNR